MEEELGAWARGRSVGDDCKGEEGGRAGGNGGGGVVKGEGEEGEGWVRGKG